MAATKSSSIIWQVAVHCSLQKIYSGSNKKRFFFDKHHHINHSQPKMVEFEAFLYGMDHNMTHEMPMYFVNSMMLHNFIFKGIMVHKWWQYMLALIIIFILAVFNQFMYSIVRRKIPTLPKGDYVSLDDR